MRHEAPEALRANSKTEGKRGIFQEIDKHLLFVSDAAAALIEAETYRAGRLSNATQPSAHAIGIPNRSDRECEDQVWHDGAIPLLPVRLSASAPEIH